MVDLIPAAQVHAELMSAIHGICFTDVWSAEAMAEMLVMPGAEGLLAVDGGSLTPSTTPPGPAGMVLWRVIGDEAEILTIAVLPPWRGTGLGRQLLEAAVKASRAKGAAMMFLEVAADNTNAQNLYLSSDFAKIGVRKAYYADKDAWVMRRDFD